MNTVVETLNMAGRAFIEFALPMLIQSGVLILILLAVDVLLRRRVRAVFRYWIWMLVLVKLVLPPSLGSPVSVGTWFGDTLEAPAASLLESESPRAAEPHATKLGEARGIGILPMDHGLEAHATPVLVPPVATSLPGAPDEIGPSVLPETSATAPPAATLDWQGLLLLIWAVVVLALMLLLVQRAFFVRGLIGQSDEANRPMLDELEDCRQRLGLRGRVDLRLSPNATSPAVCGLFRPTILIPQTLAPRLRSHDLQAVLLHELAHAKRGDLWINLVQTLLQIAYFYNPLLWLANAMIRRTREQAVDETVLVAMGEEARQYPETLVNIARLAFTRRPALSLRLIGVVESKSALTARIKHILARPLPKTARLGIFGAFLVLVVAVVLLPMAKARPLARPELDVVSPAEEQDRTLVEVPVSSDGVVTLPNGVTVEFLGLHDCGGKEDTWWRPDGEVLPEAPYGYSTYIRSMKPNQLYEVLFRISSPTGRTFGKMEGTRGRSSTLGFLHRDGGRRSRGLPDDAGALFTGTLNRAPEADQVRIDIGVGLENAWEPLGAMDGQASEAVTLADAVIKPARREGGVTLATVTHRISDREVRLVVVDKYGFMHEPVGCRTERGGGIATSESRFELPPAEVRQFRLEAQKLTWMAFKNVSLRSGQKTEVRAVLPDGDRESTGQGEPVTPPIGSPSDIMRTTGAVARLPNGAMVELVGIHDRAGGDESWWRPDGEILPVAPYDDSAAVHGGAAKTMYEALVRIDAVAGGAFAEMKWSDGDKLVPTFARGIGYGSRPRSDIPRDADNLHLVMFHPRPEATHVRIDVGVGLDHAWDPLGALDGRIPDAPVTLPGAVIHPAREEEGRTVVTVSHQIVDRAVRLVAVDRHGFIRQPTKRSDGRRDDGGTYEATFGLPLAAIQEVRVEVQKLTWVAFKNVSLRPGQKTEVQIETGSKGPIDAAAREVVLPEADQRSVVIDLATGELTFLPMQAGLRGIEQTIVYLKEGDLLLCDDKLTDSRIIVLRNATLDQTPGGAGPQFIMGYPVFSRPMGVFTVTRATGQRYQFELLSHDNKGCVLRYSPIPADRGAGGGAPVEPEKVDRTLELRIVPTWNELAPAAVAEYRKSLIEGRTPADSRYLWFSVRPGANPPDAITEMHAGKLWLLVHNTDLFIMLPSQGWEIANVGRGADQSGRPMIRLEFDSAGAERLLQLTRANDNHPLAMIVNGVVVSAPSITSGGTGFRMAVIVGNFTEQEIEDLMTSIRRGMVRRSSAEVQRDLLQTRGVVTNPAGQGTNPQAARNSRTGISGQILDPNGTPVAGAQVALCTKDKGVIVQAGGLLPTTWGGKTSEIVETDAQGRFSFPVRPDEFHVIAAHVKGFVWRTDQELAASDDLPLEPWGRVEGILKIGREVGADERVNLFENARKGAIGQNVRYDYQTQTDSAGRFVFERVPPSWIEVGYMIRVGGPAHSYTCRTPIRLEPGQDLRMTLGGEGRPVIGRFVPPANYTEPVYFGAGLRAFATSRPELPQPENHEQMTRREQADWRKEWLKTPEAQAFYDAIWHDLGRRHYAFRIENDGSFRIEDVIPGQYDFTVWLEERFSNEAPGEFGSYHGTVEVPPMGEAYSDEPLDVGDLVLKIRPPLHVGDMAPRFEARTLDGKDIRLADYRGRFVLLAFWSPVFHPELARLKQLHATYGGTGKLQIIGLGGTDTLDEVRRYVEEHRIEWPEIYFGPDWDAELLRQLGGQMQIMLIDPEGKILATWLREEKLMKTVHDAIGGFKGP